MLAILYTMLSAVRHSLRRRAALEAEILAPRHQLLVLQRSSGDRRLRLSASDRLLWVWLSRLWGNWRSALLIVKPETVIALHRKGFQLYWAWKSRHRDGRPAVSAEVRDLIRRMSLANPRWGAPRIHGELQMLGFDVSERTVSRWVQRAPRNSEQRARWKAFLKNHREVIAAMDFFTVHTVTFGILYCFFVIAHDRRRVLHCNVTRNPTSHWVMQQLREAFPFDSSHRYMIFDRDLKFGPEVMAAVKAMGGKPKRTSFRSPWQNGVAERWIESCRRDLLDHVIVLNERHLKRLLTEYVRYYHEDRTHLGLIKGTPLGRIVAPRSAQVKVISRPRLGGLHHRYERAA